MSFGVSVADSMTASRARQGFLSRWLGWSDWAGLVASIGCAIHCAAMPFVIAYLPALGLTFLADEAFHKWMVIACLVIALSAFIPGFRQHKRVTPVVVGSFGLVIISVAAFGFAGDCCASCEGGDVDAGVAIPVASGGVDNRVSIPIDACTDACCSQCTEGTSGVDISRSLVNPTAASLSVAWPWLGRIAPWLTPLGGLVLVSAHLLNRRFGCNCGCCGAGDSGGAI